MAWWRPIFGKGHDRHRRGQSVQATGAVVGQRPAESDHETALPQLARLFGAGVGINEGETPLRNATAAEGQPGTGDGKARLRARYNAASVTA